jgi:hypothetical protein
MSREIRCGRQGAIQRDGAREHHHAGRGLTSSGLYVDYTASR